jgi:hypothetical protein
VGLPWPSGTDGWGIATAEATLERNRPQLRVYYTPISSVPIALLQPICSPTRVQVRFTGAAGALCKVQRASEFGKAWTVLGTATVGPDGLGAFNDDSPAASAAFYRVTWP